jgi:hypothetical protein
VRRHHRLYHPYGASGRYLASQMRACGVRRVLRHYI